jgi:hypothetical protein
LLVLPVTGGGNCWLSVATNLEKQASTIGFVFELAESLLTQLATTPAAVRK